MTKFGFLAGARRIIGQIPGRKFMRRTVVDIYVVFMAPYIIVTELVFGG